MRDLQRLVATSVLALALYSSAALGDTNVSGTLSSDTTWLASASPYIVIDSVVVSSGRTLTVEPGVTVKFNGGKSLVVLGKLIAVGTSTAPITFTSSAASPARGSWGYIEIQAGANPASEFTFATISYGGGGGSGALKVVNGTANLNNVTVTESSTSGIRLESSSAQSLNQVTVSSCTSSGVHIEGQTGLNTIANSTFSGNGAYGINLAGGARASVTNSAFTNNTDYAIGAQVHTDLQGLTGLTATGNGSGAKNSIGYRGGYLYGNETWRNGSLGYVITGNVIVQSPHVLTVEPGSTIKFTSGRFLYIGGRLSAIGTSTAPITFTSSAASPARGSWGYIQIQAGANPASEFEFATISYGGGGGSGALRVVNGTANLNNVTVTESSTSGIRLESSSAQTLSHVTVSNCTSSGVHIEGQTGLNTIANSTFSGNGAYGINLVGGARAGVTNSAFTNNTDYAIGAQVHTDLQGMAGLTATGNGSGAKNAIGYRGGYLYGNETWRSGSLGYVILGNVIVQSPHVLTVEPGSTIKFTSGKFLYVGGRLSAIGTSTAPITFTSSAASPARGSWGYIEIQAGANPATELAFATISYGGGGASGALRVVNGTTNLNNVTVTESSTSGIRLESSSAHTLNNVTVSNCTSSGVHIEGQTGLNTIANSTFSGNGAYGINLVGGARASVTNSAFTNNTDYAIGAQVHTDIQGLTGLTATGNGSGAKNAIGYRGGYLYGNETWRNGSLGYVITADVIVQSPHVLTVEPGSTVKFNGGKFLHVEGRLLAAGTSEAPIVFTSSAASPARGSWGYIQIRSGSNPASELAYTTIAYGGAGQPQASLRVVNGAVTLNHVTVTESSTIGVYSTTTTAQTFNYVTASSCGSHGMVIQGDGADSGLHTVTDSAFLSNGGIGLYVAARGKAVVSHSRFSSNVSGGAQAAAKTDVRFCYWGSPSGPSGGGAGTGQSVDANVDFEPWLESSPATGHRFTAATIRNRTFNPAISTSWKGTFDAPSGTAWTTVIANSSGTVVRTWSGTGPSTGEIAWDGKNASGISSRTGRTRTGSTARTRRAFRRRLRWGVSSSTPTGCSHSRR
jgi:parallel beta-helix repeat protein